MFSQHRDKENAFDYDTSFVSITNKLWNNISGISFFLSCFLKLQTMYNSQNFYISDQINLHIVVKQDNHFECYKNWYQLKNQNFKKTINFSSYLKQIHR